jgi:hypothetical protein
VLIFFGANTEMADTELKKYPINVLEGFANGCLLDLRVRMAADLLKSPMFSGTFNEMSQAFIEGAVNEHDMFRLPETTAKFALDVACELVALAESKGLLDPLPDDKEIDDVLRAQASRTAQYSVIQQLAGQKFAEDEAARVSRVGAVYDIPRSKGH